MDNGGCLSAWIYFNRRETVGDNKLYKSYEQNYTFWSDVSTENEEEEICCPNCLEDVVEDAFSLYYCKSCNSWHHESEVLCF